MIGVSDQTSYDHADQLGAPLVEGRRRLCAGEAEWLGWLAEFERREGWRADGHLSCVSWLGHKCGMARATAKDKLRVACELARRPVLAAAYSTGELSYSKVRAITRITEVDVDTDEALVEAARKGTSTAKGVDKASAEASVPDPLGTPTWAQRRADALCELLEAGLAYLEAGGEVDVERAAVSVVADYDVLCERVGRTAELGGGIPLSGEAARRLACDAGLSRIIVRGTSEVLDLGRKTRHWNRAQRRAIRFRHQGRCAFPGCGLRIFQIHHTTPWEDDGLTDLEAGVPLCSGHHHLVHEGGWKVRYDGRSATTIFTGPDGREIRTPTRIVFPLVA